MADISERGGGQGATSRTRLLDLIGASSLTGGASRIRNIALVLSAIWLLVALAYAAGLLLGLGPEETGRPITILDIAMLFVAILAPVSLALFGLSAAAAIARLSEEAQAARAEFAILKQAGGPRSGRGVEQDARMLLNEMQAERAALAEVLREAAARARSGDLGRARPDTPRSSAAVEPSRPASKPESVPEPAAKSVNPTPTEPTSIDADEPPLPLDPPPVDARPALDWNALTTAMEFPDSENDRTTIEALYKVLPDPMAARLMQSAEDVLSVLAGQAIYMDELKAAATTEEDWANYLDGARGEEASAIGSVTDEKALDGARARLKRDGVFRDAALHFLLRYDAIAKRARTETGDDAHAPRMARTRTGKAYALLARALDRFDR